MQVCHSIFLLWEEMIKKKLEVYWNLKTSTDLSVNLKRYTRYLEDYASENESAISLLLKHLGRWVT